MSVKIIALLMLGNIGALAASWESLQKLPPGQAIELATHGQKPRQVTYRSLTADTIVVSTSTGEQSVPRADVERVRMKVPGRRVRHGLLFTAIGAGAGAGIGLAVCPYCFNEGAGAKFVGPGIAAGAGIGALGFLSSDYRTLYEKH